MNEDNHPIAIVGSVFLLVFVFVLVSASHESAKNYSPRYDHHLVPAEKRAEADIWHARQEATFAESWWQRVQARDYANRKERELREVRARDDASEPVK